VDFCTRICCVLALSSKMLVSYEDFVRVALPNKKKLRGFSLALPNINSGLGGA
jgi:hypothetical protein